MRELKELQNQCEEIEKIAQDIVTEAEGSGMSSLVELAEGISDEVIEMSKKVDEVKNKIMGE